MTFKEINAYYNSLYGKDIPRATLTSWIKSKKLKAEKKSNGIYDYDFDSFKNIVESFEYRTKIKASKSKPENFINKIHEQLLIKNIVPMEEREDKNYKGTIMYCDCLRCGKKNVQVRFSYLTSNGNYSQKTCGCDRKIKAFLSNTRGDLREEMLDKYKNNFEKFLFVHKILVKTTEKYYFNCPIEEYCIAIETIYNDKNFNAIYNFWKSKRNSYNTYYDWAKPSIDHIIPKSKGGTNKIDNLQVLTVFENLSKRDMTMEEWTSFKVDTNTRSDYFIENILKGGLDNE